MGVCVWGKRRLAKQIADTELGHDALRRRQHERALHERELQSQTRLCRAIKTRMWRMHTGDLV